MMNTKFIKLYFTPPFIFFVSVLPWYVFAKYALKFDIIHYFYQTLMGSHICSKFSSIFVLLAFISAYILWIVLKTKQDKALNQAAKEEIAINFFLVYGKIYGLIVSIQFVIIMILALIVMMGS